MFQSEAAFFVQEIRRLHCAIGLFLVLWCKVTTFSTTLMSVLLKRKLLLQCHKPEVCDGIVALMFSLLKGARE